MTVFPFVILILALLLFIFTAVWMSTPLKNRLNDRNTNQTSAIGNRNIEVIVHIHPGEKDVSPYVDVTCYKNNSFGKSDQKGSLQQIDHYF